MEKQATALIGIPEIKPATRIRYCIYSRKSTDDDESQILSIESQINEMKVLAEREKLEVVDIRKESHSAKDSGQRPVFKELLEDIRKGKFNGILSWAPDRLSRNAGDLGSVVDLMDQKLLVQIKTYGQTFTNTPSEKFLLMILCSQAKLENDNKSDNVKRGLRTRVEMGLWPCVAPTGYLNSTNTNEPCTVHLDPIRAPLVKQMFDKVVYENWSGKKVYLWVRHELKMTSKNNKAISMSNVFIMLHNSFYYGVFEYPRNSGKWYQGKHTPVISKEVFDEAQQKLSTQKKFKDSNKEFAFTRLMSCGSCGSGIGAQEKYKHLKDGSIKKYIYYSCTQSKDGRCKDGYLEEERLIEQLTGLMDKIDLDKSGLRKKLAEEIERHKKFSVGILGGRKEDYSAKDVDIRNYAKYILKEGNILEKRELLTNLRSRITCKDKTLTLLIE